ncbi:MAG: RnfABCDGE type electron transport complex subunit B, partial [Gammaproteobacteria bacterium]|nr:RnfABCDGE type electron transport complex subunit B [Gammaproteobacteria bacterium]
CLDACPTDAIVGMHKRMHTVIDVHCTGCELCIPVCPVDCISLDTATPGRSGWDAWSQAQADDARARYAIHAARAKVNPPDEVAPDDAAAEGLAERKRSIVEAALARARAGNAGRSNR